MSKVLSVITMLLFFSICFFGCGKTYKLCWKHPDKGPQVFDEEVQDCWKIANERTSRFLNMGAWKTCRGDCPPHFASLNEIKAFYTRKCMVERYGWTYEKCGVVDD